MSLSAYALTTAERVESFLGLEEGAEMSLFEELINSMTALFESLTNRKLKARDYSYDSGAAAYDPDNAILDGNDRDRLILPQYPVNSLTTLRINEYEIDQRSGVYSLGWVLDKSNGIVTLAGYLFTNGLANIELVYNAGYATVPEDLAQACVEQVAWGFKQSTPGSANLGLSFKNLPGGGTVSFTQQELLPSVRPVVEKYKRRIAL